MPIPDYQSLMRPLLAFASDGTEKRIGDAIEALATQLKLTDDERSQLLASGKQTIFANRVYPTRASSHVCNMADDERRSRMRGRRLARQLVERYVTTVTKKRRVRRCTGIGSRVLGSGQPAALRQGLGCGLILGEGVSPVAKASA
jgi:restriction endonuclease Mrr